MYLVGAQDHRVPAELEDAGLERRAGARRRLVEHERHRAPFERPRGEWRVLERGGAIEQQREPVRVELFAGDEMSGCGH
jgi:hypothetical protein